VKLLLVLSAQLITLFLTRSVMESAQKSFEKLDSGIFFLTTLHSEMVRNYLERIFDDPSWTGTCPLMLFVNIIPFSRLIAEQKSSFWNAAAPFFKRRYSSENFQGGKNHIQITKINKAELFV